MLKEYCKSFAICMCEVDFGVVQKSFKCGCLIPWERSLRTNIPVGFAHPSVVAHYTWGPFGSSSCQAMLLTWAVEIGNGEERCGAGQEGSGWSSTLTEGDLPRFKMNSLFLKHKSVARASRGTLGAFLCSGDTFPLMVGGFSSVVLSFQQNTLAYAICRCLQSGGTLLASVCLCWGFSWISPGSLIEWDSG